MHMIVKNLFQILKTYIDGGMLVRHSIRYRIEKRFTGERFHYHEKSLEVIFNNHVNIDVYKGKKIDITLYEELFEHYKKHEYNLLGSGWLCWNKPHNASILWNQDVKSGYVFQSPFFSSSLIENLPKGVDIKMPWELARMYHWSQMAVLACYNKRDEIITKFKNDMLDFMNANPIGIGVNFYCAMEVAIRAVNLLYSYDIFSQLDERKILDECFKKKFENYLWRHSIVIKNNLEYDFINGKSGNHYLADIVGLLWIFSYFRHNVSKKEYEECVIQFEICIVKQFLNTGCNYECSTAYHRLAAELVGIGLIILTQKERNRIIENNKARIVGMVDFLELCIGKDGHIIQIGDNDSGSVIKLFSHYLGNNEDTLHGYWVIELISALIYSDVDINELTFAFVKSYSVESKKFKTEKIAECQFEKNFSIQNLPKLSYYNAYEEHVDGLSNENLNVRANMEFGMAKFFNENVEVYVRLAPNYSKMLTAHAHDDIFHYEIVYNHCRVHEDIGSICYTSDANQRDFFSSGSAHQVPIHEKSIVERIQDFENSIKIEYSQNYIENSKIIIKVKTSNFIHIRKFTIGKENLKIEDWSDQGFTVNNWYGYHSLGYGQITKRG